MGDYTNYIDLRSLQLGEDNKSWIDLAKVGEYTHPLYGKLGFTQDKLKQFADNFEKNVRGLGQLDIDYDHKARTGEAAGWLQQVKLENGVLRGLVEWTSEAAKKIRDGAYRFFSPEYRDEWEDNQGNKHKNVLFGGGITNRPFLKNLLPINLSELSFQPENDNDPKENEVDPKQLRASIGLAEDATDAQVTERLALIKQLSEAFPSGPPQVEPKNDPPAPPAPVVPAFDMGGLTQLAETNPEVAGLLKFVEGTIATNKENTRKLAEQNVTMKLNEFNTSKLALTPVAADLVREIMLDESMTPDLSDKVWKLMQGMRDKNKFFVELGERAASAIGTRVSGGTTYEHKFNSAVTLLMEGDNKLSYPDAVERVAKNDPELFDNYRRETYQFVE